MRGDQSNPIVPCCQKFIAFSISLDHCICTFYITDLVHLRKLCFIWQCNVLSDISLFDFTQFHMVLFESSFFCLTFSNVLLEYQFFHVMLCIVLFEMHYFISNLHVLFENVTFDGFRLPYTLISTR